VIPAAGARFRALAWAVLGLSLSLSLAACRTAQAPQRYTPAASGSAPSRPASVEHFRLDPAQSEVLILVYRDGPMAALGHNHVLSVHELSGEAALPVDSTAHSPGREHPELASFALEFPVAAIAVDEPALRAQQGTGFEGALDAPSIEGTRTHMLGPLLLDASRFERIRLESAALQAEGDHWLATLHIVVRDFEAQAQVPIALQVDAGRLLATGEFDLTHAQLGLKPYSVALGALRVAETMHVRYRLLARRVPASDAPEAP
jgi:hypothetical protein